ncbi:MAG: T9SS type A sorting domain-containing protein [Chitinophagaceae bacterium]|nr:T9SS type A sorting domain-containing protein [Chitinophagaceae bacterium]
MKKFNFLITLNLVFFNFYQSFAQSPGNVGTANLTAWFNADNLPLGNATTWQTVYPTGASAITLTDATAPYATVTNTPISNVSNYNNTISFLGNTVAAPMSLEFQGTLNLLNNSSSVSTGTFFAVYYNNTAAAAQQIVDYRESTADAIQFRWLSPAVTRMAIGTTNALTSCRDFSDDAKPMIASYSGNRIVMNARKKSLETTGGISSSASTAAQLGLTVGSRRNTSLVYSGMNESYISELIFFNSNLSLADNIKVESYLAIKHGITLLNNGLSLGFYNSSNGTNIWNPTGFLNYHNDIIGIGRDDNSLLNQKQSHTFSDSTRLYSGTLSATNIANSSLFTADNSFILMGSDAGQRNETATATLEMPGGQSLISRIEREWRVTNTNMADNYSIDITLDNFTNFTSSPPSLCLLVDDDGDFLNSTVFQAGLTFSVNGNTVTVSGISTTQIPLNTTRFITLGNKSNVTLPFGGTTVSNVNPICQGDQIVLSLSGATTFVGQTYQWESSSNNVTYTPILSANADTYTVTPSANTYYHCIVTFGANSSTSSNLLININALPIVSATPATISVCDGDNVTLNGGGAVSYSWSGSVTNNNPFIPTSSTIYTVTGTDANNCSNTAISSVTVNSLPAVAVNPITVFNCIGGASTTLTASGAVNYIWNPGAISGNPVNVSPASFTTYTVVGTDGNNCSNSATANVVVTNPTGDLANSTVGNISSTTGLECNNVSHQDGINLGYFDANCKLIANVIDAIGGNVLGNVNTCVTVDPSVQNVNGQPYLRRWFEITPTSNGPANVVLYLTLADFVDYNAAPASANWPPLPSTGSNFDPNILNIRITKNDAGVLSVITPSVNWNSVSNRYELSFPVTGFSQFRVHSVNNFNAPLPVMYNDFTAQKSGSVAILNWTTGNEENNKLFRIQRSADAKNYITIGTVNSKALNGNSNLDLHYNFEDNNPMLGNNYYRLEQEDIDGKINYSRSINLNWGAITSTISVYPNPVNDVLNLDINCSKTNQTQVSILDMSGRIILRKESKCEVGLNNIKINLSHFSSGFYQVQVFENNKLISTERFTKK